jgi:heme-degrading monooxygenase HmoA
MPIVIFRSRLRPEAKDEFGVLASRMLELARSIPGFVSHKMFTAEDGEQVSIIEYETDDAVRIWCEHPEHRKAQAAGRDRFFAEYDIKVCEPVRERSFRVETLSPDVMKGRLGSRK